MDERNKKQRRYRLILAIALTSIAAGGFVLELLWQPEPSYQGNSLSVWMVAADTGQWPRQGIVPADEAIRHIGTNAFPTIRKMLRTRDTALKLKLNALLRRQSVIRIYFKTQDACQSQAIAACRALGPVAKPLVPEMARALKHMRWQITAEQWLQELGPDAELAIPALVEILKDQTNPLRGWAAQPLACIAIGQREHVSEIFHECLIQDTNSMVQHEVQVALMILEGDWRPKKVGGRERRLPN